MCVPNVPKAVVYPHRTRPRISKMRSRAVLFDPVAPNRRRFRGRPSTSHPVIITECGFHCRTGLKIDAGIIDEGRDAPVPAAAAAPTSAPWTTPIRTGAFGRARCLFGKDLVASGATKGFELKLEILIAVTDPGIADPHGCPIFSKVVRGIPFCEAGFHNSFKAATRGNASSGKRAGALVRNAGSGEAPLRRESTHE